MKPSDRDSDSYSFHDIPFVKMSQLNVCDQVETDEFKPYDICSSELSLANTDDPEKFLNTEYMIDKLLKQKKNEEKIFGMKRYLEATVIINWLSYNKKHQIFHKE